ncbi:unnamed protein product [Cladocopium goreaui]|uniref:RNA helicase n=1 Tax=Cladocopium goreaui TaxID=2562237 RepID=A0A9P1DIK9_9DINO|nr:unnamed protein product [Cladocopium goreaui]
MKRGKRGKRVPLSREAAQAFWACALHESHESALLPELPERFDSAAAYYTRLSNLVLAESKAVIANRLRQWQGPQGPQAAEATVTQLKSSTCNKVAKQRGVTGRLLSLTVNVSQAKQDWPTFRTAWLVELHPTSRDASAAPFFVERAATGRQDFSVDLCGFAPADWGWTDEHQNVLVEAPIRIRLRPLEDMVPMLRMWTACFIGPQVPFLHQLIGAKSATHRIFSDSEEEGMESEVPDVFATEMKEQLVEKSDSMQHLNTLQQEAIRKILMDSGPPSRRCHLLQGPPGTGKTRAVVALLQQLSARKNRSVVEPQSRILVSAPSNGAVQVALESFLKTQEGQQSSLCLVGVEDRVPPTGPLRSAFIHTRLQYTLTLLQQSQKDSSMWPMAIQASKKAVAQCVAHYLCSSLMWSWWSLILCMCATWSSVRDGTGLVRTGLLDGAPEVLTRLDVVLVQQVSIPLLKVDDGAKVLVHSLHTWEDFLKLVDACYGFDGPAHGAHAVGVQTMVAVDSSARMVTLHKAPGGCEYVIGDAGCPQVIAGVWSTCNHAAVKSAGFSCQPFSQLGDRKGGADPCAMSLPNNLRAAPSQRVHGLVLSCAVPACRDPFISQHLDRFVDWSGVVKENINLELSAIGPVQPLMQNQTQIDGQFLEFTHRQSQQVSNPQALMQDFETEQLHSSSSVFCTLSCSGRPSLQTLRDTVHTVLVDEAAQAVEAETLIPLCLRPKQLVLVGDPNQLSATVCHSESAKSAKFCRSMMERLMALGQDYIMLQEQYRMHPEISRFPSQRFYGGRLIDVTTNTSSASCRSSPGDAVSLPAYAVVNVAGREEENRRRGQILNRREAESLVSFARKLAQNGMAKAAKGEDGRHQGRAPEVVVITFYSGQAALIRQLLGDVKVAVHTVDSFQGSEADVVLLSFVRANARRRLGFLTEFQRLNVALTRAKRSLIVFANTDCLRAAADADDISALMADAKARGRIWDEDQVDHFFAPRKRRKKMELADPKPCVDRQPPSVPVTSRKKRLKKKLPPLAAPASVRPPMAAKSLAQGALQERLKKRKRSAARKNALANAAEELVPGNYGKLLQSPWSLVERRALAGGFAAKPELNQRRLPKGEVRSEFVMNRPEAPIQFWTFH